MQKSSEKEQILDVDDELEIDIDGLEPVDISDEDLEAADKQKEVAKKTAKKNAKLLRTPEEKKRAKRKKIIIGASLFGVIIITLFVLPFTRWPILNAVGFRGNLVLIVQEKQSKKPISGVLFELGSGQTALSDQLGEVRFNNLKLGVQTVSLKKSGYSEATFQVTNGIGTTKPKPQILKAIGLKLDVDIADWLSGKPIKGVTVAVGESKAQSDNSGRASVIIAPTDKAQVPVTVSAPGYIQQVVNVQLNVQVSQVNLVSAQKDYFISNRDGKYDVFSSNLDGSEQQKLVAATGQEDSSLMQFSVHRSNKYAILVANREGKQQNGRVVAGIYAIDLGRATLTKVDEGSDVELLGWGNDTMVYTKTDPTLNYDDPNLTKIMVYNVNTGKTTQLVQSNYIAATIVANNKLFYMPADAYRTIDNAILTSVDLTSGAHKTYLTGKQASYITRPNYNTIEVQTTDNTTFQIQVSNGAVTPLSRSVASSLQFALSQDGSQVAWANKMDGQGALFLQAASGGSQNVAIKAAGITAPVRFISSDLVVVRVATTEETADYVVSISSGKMTKIVDVSNVGAILSWTL